MYLKEIKLSQNDLKLLQFLARFKLMSANDAIYFYGSSYYQKRLQELKNANYISRYYRTYIKLTPASIRFLETINIKCQTPCRNREYIDRLVFISKLGIQFEKGRIPYKLSWELKGKNYTDWSRRFIAELTLKNEKYLVYYAKSDSKYIRQLQFDINKDLTYQNVLVILDDMRMVSSQNPFVFSNKISCVLVHKSNIADLMDSFNLSIKGELEKIYNCKVEETDFSLAHYNIQNKNILYMPFIDTHRIIGINTFYLMGMSDEKLEILTLNKNIDVIKRLMSGPALDYIKFVILDDCDEVKNETIQK